jgi:hypothetical protein
LSDAAGNVSDGHVPPIRVPSLMAANTHR